MIKVLGQGTCYLLVDIPLVHTDIKSLTEWRRWEWKTGNESKESFGHRIDSVTNQGE